MKPLLNFETESFSYKLYQGNQEEQKMIEEFKNDSSTKEFLSEFWNYIQETKEDIENDFEPQRYTSIVYYEEFPIGLITFFDLDNELIFSHGIRPSQRGNSFSSRIKKEVYDYVFRNLETVEKITVYIDVNNEKNLRSLQKLPYDEIEKIYDDKKQKEFYKVSNRSPYLEEVKKSI